MVTVAYVDSDGIERSYSIGHEPVLVGRAPECEIRSNDPLVSRKHARLYVDPAGTLFIEDLGSANGVFVGPNRIKIATIPIGAVVVAGSLRFRRLASASPTGSQLVLNEVRAARRPTHAVLVLQPGWPHPGSTREMRARRCSRISSRSSAGRDSPSRRSSAMRTARGWPSSTDSSRSPRLGSPSSRRK